jgi:hypothetical protein
MDDGSSIVPPGSYASEEIALNGALALSRNGHPFALVNLN